jgi:xylan 1,4-beta-xylosidase
MEKPAGKPLGTTYSSNDNFAGDALRLHWKFFGEYDTSRFYLDNNSIVINGRGNSVAGSSPLLCMPSDHSYSAQVELEIEGDAIGGLVLFYNQGAYSGILADNKNILANLRGWQFPTETDVIKDHVYLKLKNINDVVDMYYSTDGEKWIKIETSLEVSAYHHNVLNGFLSLRIGLVSMGEGRVIFRNFKYEPVK